MRRDIVDGGIVIVGRKDRGHGLRRIDDAVFRFGIGERLPGRAVDAAEKLVEEGIVILRRRGRGSDLGGFFRLRRLTDGDAGVIFGLGNDEAIGARRRQRYAGDQMGRRQRRAGGKVLVAGKGKHVLLPGLIVLRRFILRIHVIRRNPRRDEPLRLDRRHRDRGEPGRHRGDAGRRNGLGVFPERGGQRRALREGSAGRLQRKSGVDKRAVDIRRDMHRRGGRADGLGGLRLDEGGCLEGRNLDRRFDDFELRVRVNVDDPGPG